MIDWLNHISAWEWWILSGILFILELLVSGVFFFWFALSAAVVGTIMYLSPTLLHWVHQVLIFSGMSVLVVLFWRKYAQTEKTDSPLLNRRGLQYIGRMLVRWKNRS